jgi:hypothetical protein
MSWRALWSFTLFFTLWLHPGRGDGLEPPPITANEDFFILGSVPEIPPDRTSKIEGEVEQPKSVDCKVTFELRNAEPRQQQRLVRPNIHHIIRELNTILKIRSLQVQTRPFDPGTRATILRTISLPIFLGIPILLVPEDSLA